MIVFYLGVLLQTRILTAKLPSISDDLFPHFLRGYFDGDGSSRYGKQTGLVMKFTSGSKLLLEGIRERIISLLGITGSEIKSDKGKANAWRLYYCGKKALDIGNAMYNNADDLYIPKKKDSFSAYANRNNYSG